ncbi:hypothetical protein EYF80_046710 [Liparis tanakae]|uniref:Uncharacterized protein n=1 Tax=Liparis tanakae TaxID=230148 RepID=A0A4Z2FQ26_9TELE|nr:hypothetical protein EYF80_046710 [Liparis tanakae]
MVFSAYGQEKLPIKLPGFGMRCEALGQTAEERAATQDAMRPGGGIVTQEGIDWIAPACGGKTEKYWVTEKSWPISAAGLQTQRVTTQTMNVTFAREEYVEVPVINFLSMIEEEYPSALGFLVPSPASKTFIPYKYTILSFSMSQSCGDKDGDAGGEEEENNEIGMRELELLPSGVGVPCEEKTISNEIVESNRQSLRLKISQSSPRWGKEIVRGSGPRANVQHLSAQRATGGTLLDAACAEPLSSYEDTVFGLCG